LPVHWVFSVIVWRFTSKCFLGRSHWRAILFWAHNMLRKHWSCQKKTCSSWLLIMLSLPYLYSCTAKQKSHCAILGLRSLPLSFWGKEFTVFLANIAEFFLHSNHEWWPPFDLCSCTKTSRN
jgi:hypothetical protein